MSRHSKATKKQLQDRLLKRRQTRERQGNAWFDVVREADRLIGRDEGREAIAILTKFDEAHPGRPEVLRLLLDLYHETHDYGPYCRVCQRLLAKESGNRPLHLMLASGYLAAERPVLALQTFRRYIERWPDDPLIEGARETIVLLEPAVEDILRTAPFPADQKLELGAMHEEMLAGIEWGDYARVIQLGETLLQRSPGFVSAMNNMSQAYSQLGRAADAVAMTQRVLDQEPENFHALGNLSRLLLLGGRGDEAEEPLRRLRPIQSDSCELWSKKAEVFSFFGDDQAILDVFEQAKEAGYTTGKSPDVALLFHLAAVASARRGDWRRARQLWREALNRRPGFDLAEDNLADSQRPDGQRQGPWAYGIEYWIRRETIDELLKAFDDSKTRHDDDDDDEASTLVARRFFEQRPEISKLVPLLLDRGDEPGRQFATRLAWLLETSAMHGALRDFCLSPRGPDDLRIETANRLSQKGLLPSGRVRLWIEGEWRELELMGFEITEEPIGSPHPPQVEEWAFQGMEAVKRGDGKAAETLFQKCLEIEPDRPELLNNLAAAYHEQGRTNESDALVRQIHERWPDYFFGRTNMAAIAAHAGRYDEAEALLDPLRQRKRLHITEFSALCLAYIQLFIARRNFEAARSWLGMLKQVVPDHPAIPKFEQSLTLGGAIGRLAGLFRRPRGK